jgi:uncharacterized protein YbaR (Trm112 family)
MELVCPITHLALKAGSAALLARLNAARERGELRTVTNVVFTTPLEGILVRTDGAVGYPLNCGIPNMLPDAALTIAPYIHAGDISAP